MIFTRAAVKNAARSAESAAQSARATERAAEVSRIGTLLSTVPLLVPWVSEETGGVSIVNRGNSTSHNLRWTISIDDHELAHGSDQQVINPRSNRSRDLELSPSHRQVVVRWVSSREQRAESLIVVCRFSTSWGQDFTSTRTYPGRSVRGSSIVFTDDRGNELRLDPPAASEPVVRR